MKKLRLPARILIALLLGVLVGLICSMTDNSALATSYLKPLGDIFVNLLKFIVVPVVLFSMIEGILSMGNLKQIGSIGWKTVAYFLVTTALACVIALTLAVFFQRTALFPTLSAENITYEAPAFGGFMDTLVGIFPSNMWMAFSNGDMLQVIVIALLFGGALLAAGQQGHLCREIATSFYAVLDRLMAFIINLSPIGVFAYMAWVVATQGAAVLGNLFLVLLCAYVAFALHAVLVYSAAVHFFAGTQPRDFFRGAAAAMMFAFTTTSSAATLPVSRRCAENLGADDHIAAFVLPLGATINMDGTAIYQCVAAVFLASCAGMELTIAQLVTIVLTATITSIGTAGTPGAGMLMLTMVLTALRIPLDYIGLIVAVDRLFDMGRTCMNVAGDLSCTLCVSRWERRKQS